MAQFVIIDTDILIDLSLDRNEAVKTIEILQKKYKLSVSVVTVMELYCGCRSKKDLKIVDESLKNLHIEFISDSVSKKALNLMKKFRASHGVEINDMLIASSALDLNAKLISKNQKHYKFLPDIDLLNYPLES